MLPEKLNHIKSRVKKGYEVANERLGIIAGLGYMAASGYSLAKKEDLAAGICLGSAVSLTALDGYVGARRERRRSEIAHTQGEIKGLETAETYMQKAYNTGFENGRQQILGVLEEGVGMIIVGPKSGKFTEEVANNIPVYTSLDGKTKISSTDDLIESLGDPFNVARQVMLIMHHSTKRRLNIREIEILRRANSALNQIPGSEEMFCEQGQDVIGDMRQVIEDYEKNLPPASN